MEVMAIPIHPLPVGQVFVTADTGDLHAFQFDS